MNKPNAYILDVGKKGEERLKLLDEIYGPYTHHFLKKVGLSPGMRVLDVGCGTGNVSCFIANEVGPMGKVVGMDASEAQLELARKQAREKSLKNIEFVSSSIYELGNFYNQFDLVFCRYILVHLQHPEEALKQMYQCVKSYGTLACDEHAINATKCYPHSPYFSAAMDLVLRLVEMKGVNFNLGEKLYELFHSFPMRFIDMQVIQPVLLTSHHKMLWPMFMSEIKPEILKYHLAKEDKIDDIVHGLVEIVKDKMSYILAMRNYQIWGVVE